MRAGLTAYQQGKYAEAVQQTKAALTLAEAFGPDDPRVAATLHNLAQFYQAQGRYAEAEPLYKRALAIRKKVMGPDHPEVAESLNNLAVFYYAQGRYAEAESLYKRALAIYEKTLGPDDREVATSLGNLAVLYNNQGRYAEAEPLYKRALAIDEKTLGPEHPDLATTLDNLAGLYKNQGRYAEAEPLHKRALAIREKALGPDHPGVATSLNNLAELYHDQGRYAEAESLHERALATFEKTLGPEHPAVATILNNLAALYDTQGKYAEAEPVHKRALAIVEKTLGPEHPDVATSLENYAAMLKKTGRTSEAATLEARAAAIRAKHAKETPTSDRAISASNLEQNFPVGGTVSNPLIVGKKQVMLPPGQWVIAGVYNTTDNSGIRLLELFLIDVKADVLQDAVHIQTNMEGPASFQRWKAHPACSYEGFLHLVTNSSVEGEECWWVSYSPMTRPTKRESAWNRALEYAREKGIEFPTNCVMVGYRLADNGDFLNLNYCFSPEAEGIVPPGRIPQNPSIWHVDRFDKDPKRAEYVDRLKNWGASWLPQVRAGFKGELKNY